MTDILSAQINKQFSDEFFYLKTIDIIYNKSAKICTISFLYPQSITNINPEQKQKILKFLTESLKLNSRIILKFKKSYLDKELILKQILSALKSLYSSLASLITPKNIVINISENVVNVKLGISEKYLKTYDKDEIKQNLKNEVLKSFCAEFEFDFFEGDELDDTKILQGKIEEITKKLSDYKVTPRYKVSEIIKVIGGEIEPQPEFLAQITSNKSSVILAGKIENLTKKSYKRKKQDKEIEKFYYSFLLNEGSKKINCLYFCPKSNVQKMDKLCDGNEVIILGDIKKEARHLTAFVNKLSLCKIPENKIIVDKQDEPQDFNVVKPERLLSVVQNSLFGTNASITYNENINNKTFVVYDVETTGIDAENCELIEIGAIKIVDGIYTEKFQTLIKPKEKISSFITEITSITNEMVENAPTAENAIRDFYLFSKGAILAGYNVNFDMKFVEKVAGEIGLKFENEVQDVLICVRQKMSAYNYKLKTIVNLLGIKLVDAHRAFNDAFATAEVLLKLNQN
ncbi:MAG: exonuclease domain-containing protein [Clostridia bacterium]|nr:exonuclease domain-containing protein [Clostridia bacterium]